MAEKKTVKTFVLDTNVLLHSAGSMLSFQDNDVVIPMAVVEELDKFKKNTDELGRNARQVIRTLDRLRASAGVPGELRRGIALTAVSPVAAGKLYVLTAAELSSSGNSAGAGVFPDDLSGDSADNRILQVAFLLSEQGRRIVFVSKDINLRLKADALGLQAVDFERGKIDSRAMYTGFSERKFPSAVLNRLFSGDAVPGADSGMLCNEYALIPPDEQRKSEAIVRMCPDGQLRMLDYQRNRAWNLSPRNREQRMALDALLNPEISLVTLTGGAGTGKTLLALAAGLQQVLLSAVYERILVSRPIVPLGNDIGYLPGDKGAKLANWMQPVFDNLDFLLGGDAAEEGKGDNKKSRSARRTLDSLVNTRKLDLEALTYIRGRSIPRQYVVIDEAQNLTPHEVKTIISRAGEGTKMVLTGDPRQIDNPYLDTAGNGLSYTVEKLKGSPLFAHVTLASSERSRLAALAAAEL